MTNSLEGFCFALAILNVHLHLASFFKLFLGHRDLQMTSTTNEINILIEEEAARLSRLSMLPKSLTMSLKMKGDMTW